MSTLLGLVAAIEALVKVAVILVLASLLLRGCDLVEHVTYVKFPDGTHLK